MIRTQDYLAFLRQQGFSRQEDQPGEGVEIWAGPWRTYWEWVLVDVRRETVAPSRIQHTLRKLGLTWDDFVRAVPSAA